MRILERVQFLPTLTALAGLMTSGCMVVGVDYQSPDTPVPDAWNQSVVSDLRGSSNSLEKWWKGFRDPVLNDLIDRSREANPSLEAALEAITEARAQRGIAVSSLFPQANLSGDYVRQRASESLVTPSPPENPSNLWSSGFDAGWEIDIFGGLRRGVESADAAIGATEENYRDALITLFSEVALNYVDYRTLEQRIEVAESNIEAQEDSLELTQNRLDAGLAPKIDVTQADTNLNLSRALIPQLKAQLVATENRLSTLTGGYPGALDSLLARRTGQIPSPRAGYSAGLPVDLIRSRPDIRRAERELAAQTAQIGVAEADLYPRFTLLGSLYLQAENTGDFFNSASRSFGFGPSFQWQIFSAGRIRNSIQVEESRTRQALASYENTVLLAVEEVETSMANVAYERQRFGDLSAAVSASTETVSLIKDNYENGLVNFQNVLDAERTKFNAQDEQVTSEGLISKNYISLYKALGGGAKTELIPPPSGATESQESEPEAEEAAATPES